MEKLHQQVRIARKRLNIQRFLAYLPWCWCVALLLATIAIVLRRWVVAELDPWIWNISWLVGAMAVGLVGAVIWTLFNRHQSLDAAIELDRRFGLKERVSSSLALSDVERDTEAGHAVVDDAVRRVERLHVNDRFGVTLGRKILLPFIPAAIAILLAFALSDQGVEEKIEASTTTAEAKKQLKRSSDQLRKRIKERTKRMAEKNLKDAEDVLKEVNQGLEDLEKKSGGDRKKAMVQLNKLADQLQRKRNELGGSDELRKQLNKMKDFEKGPADKLAKAMKNGKMDAAMDEIKKIKEQLAKGEMTDKQKKKLANQLGQMKQKMEDMANAHQQAMDDLEKQIESAKQSGDMAKAGNLQDAMSKLQQQMPQMDKLREMAGKMGRASKGMKEGDASAASQALDDLAADLDEMQQDLDELSNLEATLDDISQCKDAMNCDQCGGMGCRACQGNQPGNGPGGQGEGGDGMGAAKAGRGDRAKREGDTATYKSKVTSKIGPGKAVITGQADGPNAKGRVRDSIQTEFESQEGGVIDPLTGQRLPKSHQRFVEDYFNELRGEGDDEDGDEAATE